MWFGKNHVELVILELKDEIATLEQARRHRLLGDARMA